MKLRGKDKELKRHEVVLEDRAGRVSAVEVKLAAGVASRDIRGLVSLRDALFASPCPRFVE
jgi:hypothetical protein